AEFRQLGAQGGDSDQADAGNADENVDDRIVLGSFCQEALQLLFGLAELLLEVFQRGQEDLASDLFVGLRQAISRLVYHLQQLDPASNQGLKLLVFFGCFGCQMEVHELSEAAQDLGVNGVTLFEQSHALGEVSHLPGIDDSDGNTLLMSDVDESSLIPA